MELKKGQTNNPNGRPKGVPNKATSDIKQWIQDIINNNRKKFESDLKALEPKERLQILERLLKYIVPQQQAISVEAQMEAEYTQLERLFEKAPDDLVDILIEKMTKIKGKNDE